MTQRFLTLRLDAVEALDHGVVKVSGTGRYGGRLRCGFVSIAPEFHLRLPASNPDAWHELADAIEPVVARSAELQFRASFLCRELDRSAYSVAFDPPDQSRCLRLRFAHVSHGRAVVAALQDPETTEAAWDQPRPFDAAALRKLVCHKDGKPRLKGEAIDLRASFFQQTGLRTRNWCKVDAAICDGTVPTSAFSHTSYRGLQHLKRKR